MENWNTAFSLRPKPVYNSILLMLVVVMQSFYENSYSFFLKSRLVIFPFSTLLWNLLAEWLMAALQLHFLYPTNKQDPKRCPENTWTWSSSVGPSKSTLSFVKHISVPFQKLLVKMPSVLKGFGHAERFCPRSTLPEFPWAHGNSCTLLWFQH